jgi:DNA-directed RNA polymerase subunit N (RpoN/RPB10)
MSAAQTEILCLMDVAVEWMHTPKEKAGNRERNRSDLDELAVTRSACKRFIICSDRNRSDCERRWAAWAARPEIKGCRVDAAGQP